MPILIPSVGGVTFSMHTTSIFVSFVRVANHVYRLERCTLLTMCIARGLGSAVDLFWSPFLIQITEVWFDLLLLFLTNILNYVFLRRRPKCFYVVHFIKKTQMSCLGHGLK